MRAGSVLSMRRSTTTGVPLSERTINVWRPAGSTSESGTVTMAPAGTVAAMASTGLADGSRYGSTRTVASLSVGLASTMNSRAVGPVSPSGNHHSVPGEVASTPLTVPLRPDVPS